MTRSALALAILLLPLQGAAQRRLAQDTLSPDVPSAVTCGFCAGERFGVIFRELPSPFRGVVPADFPIVPEAIEVAMASADNSTSTCTPSSQAATIMASVELYAGTTLQDASIMAEPADGEWTGETLVWAADAPLMLSTADGGGRYSLNFNSLVVRDDMSMPIRIESGSYLRVSVTIPAGAAGSSPMCEPMYMSPAGFPFRDEGRVAPKRSFIYAAGVGWLWNEDAGVGGDWSIRMTIFAEGSGMPDAGTPDAGTIGTDAGAAIDAGADGGSTVMPAGGCGCRAAAPHGGASILALLLCAALARRRRAHAPAGSGGVGAP